MKRFGIKAQILLITLIPVFLIDLFFTASKIESNIEQASELLHNKGSIIARQIAGASEFNLYTGNDSQIQYLLDQSVGSNDIVLAAIFDRRGNLIAEAVAPDYRAQSKPAYHYFRQPILSRSIQFSDVFEPDADILPRTERLGWVHLYLSRQRLERSITRAIIDAAVFFIAILLMALVLTAIISQRITQPIFRLMEHLRLVETGQLGKIIEPTDDNEIGAVQKGFNRMTQSLLANRKHLNERIQQATRQLNEAITDLEAKNRELGFARDQAQDANRVKSEFLANMSHEIRTPINGIRGFISLLSQSDLEASQRRYVDIILKSTTDLTNIVNEILDFTKMESGKLQLVDETFDLHAVIEQTRDILFINVLTKDIDLNLVIYSDTPRRVIGDKLRLKQILLNLIGNAIKFTDIGRVVIRVEPEEFGDGRTGVRIVITDTGIGISEEDQQNLFQAFSQVESADNRRFAGTGLGLVISKNLATLMGGDIAMHSTAGEGSEFTLTLPFDAARDGAEDATDDHDGTTAKALILGSDRLCLGEIRSLFDRAGIITETFQIERETGTESVRETVQRNLPYIDLLVLDLRHLRCEPETLFESDVYRATRVIFMHYDQGFDSPTQGLGAEFLSVISSADTVADLCLRGAPKTASTGGSGPAVVDSPKRVLLVDDNPVNLGLASELIRLWGHQVTAAQHGSIALEYYRRQEFDLIVLDIQMPDIDGASLLQMMREIDPDDRTPVIALTANILDHEAEKLLQLGFDYLVGKPIDEIRFREILGADAQRKPGRTAPADDDVGGSTTTLDYRRSLALSADNESLLRQIFEILRRDVPEQQQQLAAALREQDRDRLGALAHKLHGVTCYAGLPRLRHLVIGLQKRLAQDSETALDPLIDEIIDELGAIEREVDSLLSAMPET